MICCINGKFLKENDCKVSIFDHGFLYSDGFYDTMKSFYGVVLDRELHLQRIEKSLKKLSLKLPWDIEQIGMWIEKMALLHKQHLARVRLTITRGCNDFDFTTCKHPTLTITAEPITIDSKIYRDGVSVFTLPMLRVLPEVKTLGVVGMTVARRLLSPKHAFEAIFVNQGFVREGSITNVFMVKNGILYTPKSNILKGITRAEVIKVVRRQGLKLIQRDFKVAAFLKADEIFLTNTKFGVTPVVSVNGRKIGTGKVGSYTKKIMQDFNSYVEEYLREHSVMSR